MNIDVFVTRAIPAVGIERLRAAGLEVQIHPGAPDDSPSREQILAGAQRAGVLLSLLTEPIDAGMLEAMPRLLGIANYAVGHDNIDLEAATRLGIPVSNTPGVLTESTADLTWALLLAVARRIVPGDAVMRAGRFRRWGPQLLLGQDVGPGCDGRRRTLGIVGMGRIGSAVARRACGFEMDVLAHDGQDKVAASGTARWASMDELLRKSDFVTLHVPLTTRTRHLIGAPELAIMKPGAFLVNTSRGAVVDECALVEALQRRQIAGAALDVYEHEPATAPGLTELDNVVLLPHLGSATDDTRARMATMAADNAVAMRRGEVAQHCVNPAVYGSAPYRHRLAAAPAAPDPVP